MPWIVDRLDSQTRACIYRFTQAVDSLHRDDHYEKQRLSELELNHVFLEKIYIGGFKEYMPVCRLEDIRRASENIRLASLVDYCNNNGSSKGIPVVPKY